VVVVDGETRSAWANRSGAQSPESDEEAIHGVPREEELVARVRIPRRRNPFSRQRAANRFQESGYLRESQGDRGGIPERAAVGAR